MSMKSWIAGLVVALAALGTSGCRSDHVCRDVDIARPDTRPWPDFTDSERFVTTWLSGDGESLSRTLQGMSDRFYCSVENFPAALTRFWYTIR